MSAIYLNINNINQLITDVAKDLDLELQDLSPDKDIFKEDVSSQKDHKGNKPNDQQKQHVLGNIERNASRAHQQSTSSSPALPPQSKSQSKHNSNHQQQRRSSQQNKNDHQQSSARRPRQQKQQQQQRATRASETSAHSNESSRSQSEGDASKHHQTTTKRDVNLPGNNTNIIRGGTRRDEYELFANCQKQKFEPTTAATASTTRQPKSPTHRTHLLGSSCGSPLVQLETSTRFDENFDQVDARRPRVIGATRKQPSLTVQLNGSLRKGNRTNSNAPTLVECKFSKFLCFFVFASFICFC